MNQLYYQLAALCSYIIGHLFSHRHLHVARFARLDEVSGLVCSTPSAASLLLGRTKLGHLLEIRATEHRPQVGNLLAVAQTRGGKGLLAISQLLSWKHSVIVNDIKGDLFTKTAGQRAQWGPVYVVDPPGGVGHRYDPLSGKHTEHELLSAAANFLYQPDEGEGAIFTQRASNMLTQLFLAARRENRPPLPYVRQLVRSGLLQAAERLHLLDPELATQFLDVPIDRLNLNDRFLLSAWSTLSARLRPLLTDSVVRCFNGSDFTAQDLLLSDRPVTVYLRWKERDLLALSPLVRLFWKSFTDELTDTYDARDGRGCHPVLFLIDEAGRTAIPSLSDAATTVVGRGISLWISVQSLSQLEAEYGKARAETLLDNMDTQLYYRPGNRPGHQTTAELLERALGDSSGFAESRTSRHGHDASEARSEQAVPLLSAWELRQLHDEDVIGFHRGLPPFRMTRLDWRALPLFSKRATIPPPLLAPLPQEDVPSPVELGVAARSQAACLL